MVESSLIQVQTTTESEAEAKDLALKLLQGRFCACVKIVPNVRSIYHWKGQTEETKEFQLLITSKVERLTEIEKMILENHSYETPEIISLEILESNVDYENWAKEEMEE